MNNPEKLATQVTQDEENKNKKHNTDVWQNSKWCLSGMFKRLDKWYMYYTTAWY